MHRSSRRVGLVSLALLTVSCSTDPGLSAGTATKPATTAVTTAGPSATAEVSPASAAETTTTTEAPSPAGALDWGGCDDTVDDASLQCATLAVPFDYDNPEAATLDIALVRLPAADAGRRVGAILTNPGGPGGSGVDFLTALASRAPEIFGDEVTDRFDLVGFDPRGVDRSAGIHCVDDAWLDAHLYLDPTPETPEEVAGLAAADTEFVQACRTAVGPGLVEYSTVSTARDMDRIRAAMGDEQISYYGASYGTYLGGVYATLFPERVRAMVLDSAYSPVGDDPVELVKTQLVGFEGAFANWVTWCNARPSCEFNDGTDAGTRWDALSAELDAAPLSAGGRSANQAVLYMATISSLYSKATWSILANALGAAAGGDGTRLLALADSYHQRGPDGHYSTIRQANQVIACASGLDDVTIPDPDAVLAELRAEAPRFGAAISAADLTSSCAELTGTVQPTPVAYAGSAPIMVVGGTNDPATPFRWAEKMAGELDGVLVTFDGEGHASLTSSTCVSSAAVALLVELTPPPTGTVCAPNAPAEAPPWWSDQPGAIEGLTPVDVESGGELLGLPPDIHLDVFATDADAATTVDRLTSAYRSVGWIAAGEQDLPIGGDTRQVGFISPDGEIVIVTVIGAASFSDPDVAPLAGLVPAGSGLVLRFPPPT